MAGYFGSKRSSSLVSFDDGTIGSGVTFPAGHIIQIQTEFLQSTVSITTGSNTFLTKTIDIRQPSSDLLIEGFLHAHTSGQSNTSETVANFDIIDNDGTTSLESGAYSYRMSNASGFIDVGFIISARKSMTAAGNYTISIKLTHNLGLNKVYPGSYLKLSEVAS